MDTSFHEAFTASLHAQMALAGAIKGQLERMSEALIEHQKELKRIIENLNAEI